MKTVLLLLVRGYRRFLSPLKPPVCRFHPTCSQYAIDALQLHGAIKGSWLTTKRILRCQPFGTPGWDPVPQPASDPELAPPQTTAAREQG